ncbi:glutathione-dependent formaldehyde-activating [Fusarium austroafricanum]|uniref:Glutathione-dependent formaldehyde-activating n=1 Tax=Fusarium austroafricanum TaxID=2364996 RepID=A0A8H4KNQ8_9HYPO|nr:glutathione-dependent formaldehyde-activating [Fusarium austroafricanum]
MAHYSQNKDILPLTGGCACGLIRYQLSLHPLLVHCCYCTVCQRQTGSVLALNALIESSALSLLPSAPPTLAGSASNPGPIRAGVQPVFARLTSAESAIREPQPKARTLSVCLPTESGVGQTVVSCPACHTGLWSNYADGGAHMSYIRVGTLDRPWEIQPDVHIYTQSRQSWVAVNDGKPSFDGYYPKREVLLREDALKRYEALQPEIGEMHAELKAGWE